MIDHTWTNLPVKDLGKSKAFYEAIGFEIQTQPENEHELFAARTSSSNVIMLIHETRFAHFAQSELTQHHANALISISVNDKHTFHQLMENVSKSGGEIKVAGEMSYGYYGGVFTDIDGHHFNVIVM
ncbi:VOC family protein [Staphylococcus massiliensis]|uniref:Putative member of glyoxalase/bleomycin resistance protein family n=1 Tax=Staphylococcus massiliensis S46 TaxID=1229783 RepID=K9AXX3_9STAP|nr:VOC family protein [Staphylococcus massiliensis]EKU46360.1 putative member of glyoxalase/bleomycin resistance protein family [Staphylococcus massiliensis S46]MCG3398659.1 member of glyoxalase/bleomycin resistance protein family [Staphylococcus massiliensis]MCG3401221.1 member of glyoxalase/bleomycin resistance protein family [Staphylococcus massiliensis]MCG3412602.1 member of glyoxalase/bleomycin resistance protein family [Staphylococcus massiliensis]POA01043.1 member of glyoxalase/bleomyci